LNEEKKTEVCFDCFMEKGLTVATTKDLCIECLVVSCHTQTIKK